MKPDIDLYIPTAKQIERLPSLLAQINAGLNSGLNARVTISMDGEYPELNRSLSDEQIKKIRFVQAPQGNPSITIEHCLENTEWADWLYIAGDDDAILPWGLKHLYEARECVSMVLGQVLCVSREKHWDLSSYKVGQVIVPCHISGANLLINTRSMEKLEKPWLINDPQSDYFLIKRMAENFKYTIIPSVVAVLCLCELDNLGTEFTAHWMSQYGRFVS